MEAVPPPILFRTGSKRALLSRFIHSRHSEASAVFRVDTETHWTKTSLGEDFSLAIHPYPMRKVLILLCQ